MLKMSPIDEIAVKSIEKFEKWMGYHWNMEINLGFNGFNWDDLLG